MLDELGAEPGDGLFIDHRAENTASAAALGIEAITFVSGEALHRELRDSDF